MTNTDLDLSDLDFSIGGPDRGETAAAYNRRMRTPFQRLAAAVLHSAAELVDRPTKDDLANGMHRDAVLFVADESAVRLWFMVKSTRLEEL